MTCRAVSCCSPASQAHLTYLCDMNDRHLLVGGCIDACIPEADPGSISTRARRELYLSFTARIVPSPPRADSRSPSYASSTAERRCNWLRHREVGFEFARVKSESVLRLLPSTCVVPGRNFLGIPCHRPPPDSTTRASIQCFLLLFLPLKKTFDTSANCIVFSLVTRALDIVPSTISHFYAQIPLLYASDLSAATHKLARNVCTLTVSLSSSRCSIPAPWPNGCLRCMRIHGNSAFVSPRNTWILSMNMLPSCALC
jgi:hypothetical protein